MANGASHTAATVAAAGVGIGYLLPDNPVAAVGWAVGGVFCTIVQPDLDQIENGGYYGLHVVRQTANRMEKLWRIYWHPYALLFAHRSPFTHLPIVGSVGRLVYIGWFWIPFCWQYDWFPSFVLAVLTMDALHWIMDWRVWTWIRIFRQ